MDKLVKVLLSLCTGFFIFMGCYILFKQDLSFAILPLNDNNPEGSAEIRAVLGGSLVAFGYLLLRFLSSSSNVTVSSILIYILVCINGGRFISLFYEGFIPFSLYSWLFEFSLLVLIWYAHKNRKYKIDYYT